MNRLALVFVIVAASTTAYAQSDSTRQFLLTEKSAIALLPPEVVCGPEVQSVSWSPDGKSLAIRRRVMDITPEMMRSAMAGQPPTTEPSIQHQVLVWNLTTKKSQVLLSLKPSQGRIEKVIWLPGTSALVTEVQPNDPGAEGAPLPAVVLLTMGGKAQKIYTAQPGRSLEVFVSPKRPVVAVSALSAATPEQPGAVAGSLRYLGLDGRPEVEIPLKGSIVRPEWSPDGQTLFANVMAPVNDGQKTRMDFQWTAFNRATGAAEKSSWTPTEVPPLSLDFEAVEESLAVSGRAGEVRAPTVMLVSPGKEKPEVAVVATDATSPLLNPQGDAVAFKVQGALMVKPLVRMPKEAFFRARETAERNVVMSNAKQAALALIIFASDMDDTLPSNGNGWQEKVNPYIRNSAILNGFVYSFPGGSLKAIKDPSSTVLGYFLGPAGRAIAYCDGRVRWEPAQP